MKSAAIYVLAAALVLACWPRESWAALDELEDLFSLDATPPRDSLSRSALPESEYIAPSLTPTPNTTYDERGWYAPAPSSSRSTVSSSSPAAKPAAAPHEPKPAHAPPINAVPEPSAWLLAVAALLYFVVFGRRRRLA